MRARIVLSALTLALVTTAAAEAQDKQAPAKKEGEVKAGADGVRRDPQGVKGISPYAEELAKGRKAASEKNWDVAANSFAGAIAVDGKQAAAYLLKAQVHVEKGEIDVALATAQEGRGKQGNEEVQSKLAFLVADLQERKADTAPGSDWAAEGVAWKETLTAKWEAVKGAWATYTGILGTASKAPDYRASADERKKQADARVQRDKDYGDVRTRAAKNEKEADESRVADEQKNPEKK
jgi:hypothetical protein